MSGKIFWGYYKWIRKYLEKHTWQSIIGAVIVCSILLYFRKPDAFLHPQFWAEDGRVWFADAYNNSLFKTIATPYAGTFGLGMRLIGLLALTVPLRFAPLVFNLAALAVQLIPVVLLCSGRLKKMIPSRLAGVIFSILYVSVPNATEVFLNVANIQWHLGVAGFLVLFAEKSNQRFWKIFDIAVLVLVGLSGPLGLMLAPIILYLYFRNRSPRNRLNFIIIAASSVLQAFSLLVLSHGQRLNSQPSASLIKLLKMIVGQIFTGGLAGSRHVELFYNSTPALLIVLLAGLGLCAYAVINGPLWLRAANAYSLFIFVFSLISLKPTPGVDLWGTFTHPAAGQRYWYIPILVWIMTILWLLFNARLRPLRYICLVLIAVLIFIGIPSDWSIPKYQDMYWRDYAAQFDSLPKGTSLTIPINPETWNMVLTKH